MVVRRRSPFWIREMRWEALHRLGGRLINLWHTDGLSGRQVAVWDAVVSELDYRNRRRLPQDRCTCQLCMSPFIDDPAEVQRDVEIGEDLG